MANRNSDISDIWVKHSLERFRSMEKVNLKKFREPGGINNRLASWDPYDLIPIDIILTPFSISLLVWKMISLIIMQT